MQGWLEGYLLTGRHGLYVTYEAFAMVSASMTVQHAKWLRGGAAASPWRAPIAVAEHPADVDVLAKRPQRLQPPGTGSDRRRCSRSAARVVAHRPAARRELPALGGRPLPPQPQLREPDRHRQAAAAAVARHRRGARALRARRVDLGLGGHAAATSRTWSSRCAGDMPTLETVAAARCSATHAPELRVRVVNVVDLMALFPAGRPSARPVG